MPEFQYSFKSVKNFDERKNESKNILEKYPNRIPVIVEKSKNSSVNDIDKHKFLVPNDLTVGQFIHVIRKRINANAEQGIFIFVKERILPPTSSLMVTTYDNYKDNDGFLYMIYSSENTFGK